MFAEVVETHVSMETEVYQPKMVVGRAMFVDSAPPGNCAWPPVKVTPPLTVPANPPMESLASAVKEYLCSSVASETNAAEHPNGYRNPVLNIMTNELTIHRGGQ